MFHQCRQVDSVADLTRWTPFTEEERQMLFKYIAQRIPKSTTPGRSGNKIYEQLMEYAKKVSQYITPAPALILNAESSRALGPCH